MKEKIKTLKQAVDADIQDRLDRLRQKYLAEKKKKKEKFDKDTADSKFDAGSATGENGKQIVSGPPSYQDLYSRIPGILPIVPVPVFYDEDDDDSGEDPENFSGDYPEHGFLSYAGPEPESELAPEQELEPAAELEQESEPSLMPRPQPEPESDSKFKDEGSGSLEEDIKDNPTVNKQSVEETSPPPSPVLPSPQQEQQGQQRTQAESQQQPQAEQKPQAEPKQQLKAQKILKASKIIMPKGQKLSSQTGKLCQQLLADPKESPRSTSDSISQSNQTWFPRFCIHQT